MQTATLVSGQPAESLHLVRVFKEINLGDWEGLSVAEVRNYFPGAYELRSTVFELTGEYCPTGLVVVNHDSGKKTPNDNCQLAHEHGPKVASPAGILRVLSANCNDSLVSIQKRSFCPNCSLFSKFNPRR